MTGTVVTSYGWDAASNMVTESASDDASTSQVGDGYAITRSVNAGNQLISLVKDPVLLPAPQTATTAFTYDLRGNRTGEVTTTQTGNATHTVASASYGYNSRDQLTSTTGPDGSASWVRDGAGRALTVTEGESPRRFRKFDSLLTDVRRSSPVFGLPSPVFGFPSIVWLMSPGRERGTFVHILRQS